MQYETDPTGRAANAPGSKLDAGKEPVFQGVFDYFPRALLAVADVSAFGATKYTWRGWETVPDGVNRYGNALSRHLLKERIEGPRDSDSNLLHQAHAAWNALARLEQTLREAAAVDDLLTMPDDLFARLRYEVEEYDVKSFPASGSGSGRSAMSLVNLQEGIALLSGALFDYNDPAACPVDIDDIATALSNVCRFAGHLPQFYSVAQHSVNASLIVPEEFAFTALMHDTAEAFTNDLPSPLKWAFPVFKELEVKIETAMAERFGFTYPLPDAVKTADLQMLKLEKENLKRDPNVWAMLEGCNVEGLLDVVDLSARTPAQAKRAFLQRFYELTPIPVQFDLLDVLRRREALDQQPYTFWGVYDETEPRQRVSQGA